MWMAYFCRQGRITKYPVVPSQCAFKSDPPRCIYFSLEKKMLIFVFSNPPSDAVTDETVFF